ncbi:MAG: hypothetical protein REI94_08245 [Moraxellaceae bacterium]|nr:hypothetical protein [Moraxellaceae bacterium]
MKTPFSLAVAISVLSVCLNGCSSSPSSPSASKPAPAAATATPAATPPPAAPIPVEVFETAILSAANTLLGKASLPAGGQHMLVIDPLIDGMTGEQTAASRAMGERIARLVRERYAQQYAVQPFNRNTVVRAPLVLIGTLTPINREGRTEGDRDIYRICLALADLRASRIVGKGVARALPAGVDGVATAFYQDSPAWGLDVATAGYIKTCQGTRPGDPMDPAYLDRIVLGALISEGIDHYNAGRYKDALGIYTEAHGMPGGAEQLRVMNGLYLSNARLKRTRDATAAFDRIVDHGLRSKRLPVKLLFRPGGSNYVADASISGAYPMWLERIARAAVASKTSCLEVQGHSGPAGSEQARERIAKQRADFVRTRLVTAQPSLAKRVTALGMGSREALVGTGRDDASDVLDRRVSFRLSDC